jgi:hypothetical protein
MTRSGSLVAALVAGIVCAAFAAACSSDGSRDHQTTIASTASTSPATTTIVSTTSTTRPSSDTTEPGRTSIVAPLPLPTPGTSSTPVRIVTLPDRTGMQAGFRQVVEIDPATGCLVGWDGILLVWPPGWVASQAPPGARGPDGELVVVGDTIQGGGGYYSVDFLGPPGPFADCVARAVTPGLLVLSQIDLRPATS